MPRGKTNELELHICAEFACLSAPWGKKAFNMMGANTGFIKIALRCLWLSICDLVRPTCSFSAASVVFLLMGIILLLSCRTLEPYRPTLQRFGFSLEPSASEVLGGVALRVLTSLLVEQQH